MIISKLYALLELNYDSFHAILSSCMEKMIGARSWKDVGATGARACTIDGVLVFKVLSVVLAQ